MNLDYLIVIAARTVTVRAPIPVPTGVHTSVLRAKDNIFNI